MRIGFEQLSFLPFFETILKYKKRRLKSKSKSQNAPKIRKAKVVTNDPRLLLIWQELQKQYFPNNIEILEYTVAWSARRQKRVLASCNLRRKLVVVARELDYQQHHQWLSALIYHEMCHAYLGYSLRRQGRKIPWHGAEFKKLESLHPESVKLNAWIKSGGWLSAVRSHRSKLIAQKRKSAKK